MYFMYAEAQISLHIYLYVWCLGSRKPRPGKLFQHLILLLKQGGIQDEVFMQFAESALDKIRTCFTNVKAAFKGTYSYFLIM